MTHPSRTTAARRRDWIAAALLGLITSSWSTLVAQLAATRLGRDAWLDWMIVAAIPMQQAALRDAPDWSVILVGILFHQSADFVWALVFFGLAGRWTARLSPRAIAAVALPWAIFTSAAEYFVIVPFWQPVFVLEQPYWIGLLVHATSASLYPLYPWLRDAVARRPHPPHRRVARRWAAGAGAVAAVLGVLAWLGASGHEWPPNGGGAEDAAWMRRMAAHHRQGIAIAGLAEQRAEDPRLRSLARLMAAAQASDIAVLRQWHLGWFAAELPDEHGEMPGMLGPSEMAGLSAARGAEFDAAFVVRMTRHHLGAVQMADWALRNAGDPRLRVMAHALRHAQRGEIELMHGIPRGFAVGAAALSAMLDPFGEGSAEARAGFHGAGDGQSHHSSSPAAASHIETIATAPAMLRGR
ncbi:DUF305 domain-containing protein [Falsiroseomonas sp. HW251]|uniref:DUF305 domain-containing protein n=1 Tax=Falsiroseomonas sp. HW251 TaxID=3390998 RepID=UPI003D313C31